MFLLIELLFIVILSMILVFIYLHERMGIQHIIPHARVDEFWSGAERREHFRFDTSLDVEYTIEKRRHIKQSGKTVDVSQGGAKLVLDEKLSKGTIIDLKISVPRSRTPVLVEGEVVWTTELPGLDPAGKRLFHTGIRFTGIRDRSRGGLATYIHALAAPDAKT